MNTPWNSEDLSKILVWRESGSFPAGHSQWGGEGAGNGTQVSGMPDSHRIPKAGSFPEPE